MHVRAELARAHREAAGPTARDHALLERHSGLRPGGGREAGAAGAAVGKERELADYQQLRRASFGSTLRALNSFENIAVSVADGAFRGFDPFRFPEVYDSVTRADVEAFLRESIVGERSALSILIPKKEGASQ